MSGRLARLALRLYPLAFQRRYGEVMRGLLEATPPRLTLVVDLLRGAAMAHLGPASGPAGAVDSGDRLRASASVDAAQLTGTANGPFQAMSTGASLVVELIVMAIAGALALTTTRRGWLSLGRPV